MLIISLPSIDSGTVTLKTQILEERLFKIYIFWKVNTGLVNITALWNGRCDMAHRHIKTKFIMRAPDRKFIQTNFW